jgi:hypothetical protein
MFISMKTSKNLSYNGKSDGKRGDPSDFKILRLLRFARNDRDFAIIRRTDEVIRLVSGCLDCFASLAGDKREHPSIPYTLTPTPYRWCAHVSAIKINNLQGQKRDMSASSSIKHRQIQKYNDILPKH